MKDKYKKTVKKNIEENATFNRKYDKLNTGDKVRVLRKPDFGKFKFDFDNYKPGFETIQGKGANHDGVPTYKLTNVPRPLLRHELKQIPAAEVPTVVKRRATRKQPVRFA